MQRKSARHAQIGVGKAGTSQDIAAEGAVSASRRLGHGRRIEVSRYLRAAAATGYAEISCQVGEGVAIAAVGSAGCAIPGAENGEGSSRLERDNAAHLPVTQDSTEQI